MSIDPKQVGAHILDPQTLNRYAYTRNNPLAYVDPDGRDLQKAWGYVKQFVNSISVKISVVGGVGEKVKVGANEAHIGIRGKYSLEVGGQGYLGEKNFQTSRSVEVGVEAGREHSPIKVGESVAVTQVTGTDYVGIGPKGEEPITKEVTDSIGGHSNSTSVGPETVGVGAEVAVGIGVGAEVNTTTEGIAAAKDAISEVRDSLKDPGPPPPPTPPAPPPCTSNDKNKKC
jgi:hypothetical protein